MKLEGKVVIVTGAGSGIGRACALEYGRHGGLVVIADIDPAGAQQTAEMIRSAGGLADFVQTDVSKGAEAERLARTVEERHGRINALHNNAGVEGNGSVEVCDEAQWDRVLGINLKGVFLCSKYVVPALRKQGGGVILNTASVSAFWGEPGTVSYNASKGGILALTRAMAMDHGRDKIRVNCLCPGYTNTGMVERYFRDQPNGMAMMPLISKLEALGRIGDPGEIARAALFLLSDDCAYATGAAFVVDGGMTAGYPWL
jgi:meso-butanediol dehydrogenase / (S,S)-butanediol dehydrogenase / diacetyl reductase